MARRPRANRVLPSTNVALAGTTPPKTGVPPPGSAPLTLKDFSCAALLIVSVFVAYLPALNGGLIMDDVRHITRPELRSVHGLWRAWFELGATSQYYPFLHSAFWIEHRFWGDSLLGYHLVNILLHGVAACLVAMIVRRLSLPGAWLAGFIFALHPVCVNSVAWISEQKSTLSAVFYLAAALTYLQFDQTRRKREYFLALVLFVLALLSKTVTATLPAALLVILWWKRGKLDFKRDVRPLLPWIATGAAAGLFTAWMERKYIGAEGSEFTLTLLQRCLLAGRVIWFYFLKLVWPSDLMFIYPRWKIDSGTWWQYAFPLGVLAVAFILWPYARRNRGPLAGFLFFAGTLFPVLGFLNVYPFIYSYVSDHYQYLAALGVIVPLACGLSLAAKRARRFAPLLAGVLVAILGLLTWREAALYKDAGALYSDNLSRNPNAWVAHNNLGVYLFDISGQLPAAIGHFQAALLMNPNDAEAHHNLAGALAKSPGHLSEAIAEFEAAERLKPNEPDAYSDLGRVLAKFPDRLPQAIVQFETASRLAPNKAEVHVDLGMVLSRVPDWRAEAVTQFEAALRLNPESAEAHNGLGNALASMGRIPEAASHFEAALRLNPQLDYAHMNLGDVFSRMRRWPEAAREYESVLRLAPNYPEAENNLGLALLEIPSRSIEAKEHFEAALRNNPDSVDAHMNLGSILANAGRTQEAVAQFEAALRIQPDFAKAHSYLGIVLSGIPGRNADAIAQFEAALRIQNDPETRQMLDHLRAGRP